MDGCAPMTVRILIRWPERQLEGLLRDTPSTRAVLDSMPVAQAAVVSGEELRLALACNARLDETATQTIDPGMICYWVEGGALVLPFGLQPISRGYECCLATAVNVLGRIEGDFRQLATVREGDPVFIERLP